MLWHAKRVENPDPLRSWALKIEAQRGHNKAASALANKLARIGWAVSTKETSYRPTPTS